MKLNQFSHRRTLLPFLAKYLKAKTYLEVGVKGGKTFLPIRVRKKIAVDPVFKIKKPYKRSQTIKYPFNLFAQYFECTSDDFFAQHASGVLAKESLDLAFIDGLHTFEQSYQDIINTLPYLKPSGVMVVHDCSPHSSAAAYPAESIADVKRINPAGFDGLWSGDVWKVVPKLKLNFPDLSIFVVDQDSGLAVISKQPLIDLNQPISPIGYTDEDIENWDYAYLEKHRQALLSAINAEQAQQAVMSLTE